MKKLLPLFIILLGSLLFAAEQQGPTADVELVSGTKQRAQFLGIEKDTVLLGGFIENKFTVVRIAKDKFKSIKDLQGNDLLNAAIKDSTATKTTAADSINVATADSTASDSIANSATEATTSSVPQTIKLSSETVFLEYESSINDSLLVLQFNALTAKYLMEEEKQIHIVKHKDFSECSDNICIQNTLAKAGAKKIYMGKIAPIAKTDSISISMTRIIFDGELPELYKNKLNLPAGKATSEALANERLKLFLMEAQGKDVSSYASNKSYIHIDTDPEGANVSLSDASEICKTPCTFFTTDTSNVVVYAYWTVDNQVWGSQVTIHPFPGDTAKASLKLKRVNPELRVITQPTGAEIYSSKEDISKHSDVLGTTPDKFPVFEPGQVSFKLRKFGYKDTLVTVYVPPISEVTTTVELEQITDFNEIENQKKWEHDRYMLRLGKTIMGVSIAPIVVGAIFTYLGHLDYNEADDLKKELNYPATAGGDNYQKVVKENHDLVDKGDKKTIIGLSLMGAGVLVLGAGFFIAF